MQATLKQSSPETAGHQLLRSWLQHQPELLVMSLTWLTAALFSSSLTLSGSIHMEAGERKTPAGKPGMMLCVSILCLFTNCRMKKWPTLLDYELWSLERRGIRGRNGGCDDKKRSRCHQCWRRRRHNNSHGSSGRPKAPQTNENAASQKRRSSFIDCSNCCPSCFGDNHVFDHHRQRKAAPMPMLQAGIEGGCRRHSHDTHLPQLLFMVFKPAGRRLEQCRQLVFTARNPR